MTLWQKGLPSVSKALLEALEERFPERCPEIDWEDRRIWFYSGQRELIKFLRAEYDNQNKTVLKED
jgi:hypothetical protein